jgi:HD-GYP domain-containing protein (c-di-GMP phosphodiesterase class II)
MGNKCLHEACDKTIKALVSAIGMRGPYPSGHHQRVADLTHAIGTVIGLPNSQLEGLCVASLTCDIGKTSVPLSVLRQDPAQLSRFEREIFRTHLKIAYGLLKEIDFPWPVAQIVLQHHESLDGSGYPEGLHGQDILVEARILTVANVVETLTSHQP